MTRIEQLCEGKAKKVFAAKDPELPVAFFRDHSIAAHEFIDHASGLWNNNPGDKLYIDRFRRDPGGTVFAWAKMMRGLTTSYRTYVTEVLLWQTVQS